MNLQPLLDSLTANEEFSLDGMESSDWAQLARAIRHGVFGQTALVRLAASAAGKEAAVPVLAELTADLGVPLAIARALLTEDSVDQLTVLLEDTGLQAAWDSEGPAERLVVPLARLLGTPRAWMWLARGLFHSSVVVVVPEMVRDSDVAVRVAAIEALTDTPGDGAIEAMFSVLHAASDPVRAAARAGLEKRCIEPSLRKRLDDELAQVNLILASASGQQLRTVLEGVPGLSALWAAVGRSQKLRPSEAPATPREGVLEGLRRRFRLIRGREDAGGYVALAIALAWADEAIGADESKTLETLIHDFLAPEERAPLQDLIRERPAPERLAEYIQRLKDPARVAAALRKDLALEGEAAGDWLQSVARAAGLPEEALGV